jgi:Amt family ammonium transporter
MKNFMDFALGSIVFWVIGFGLMFGKDIAGLIGAPRTFLSPGITELRLSFGMAYFIFQTVFCATSATIVSAAPWRSGPGSQSTAFIPA